MKLRLLLINMFVAVFIACASGNSAKSTEELVAFKPPSQIPNPIITSTLTALPIFTPTISPTQFYEEYFLDWLISQESELNRGNIVQTGSSPLFASEIYPNTPDSYLDLDSSIYTKGKSDLEFIFVNSILPNYHLIPQNGTKFIYVMFSQANLETCVNSDYSISLDFIAVEIEKGNYFCTITSDQRFSLFHIDIVKNLGDGGIRLSFVTLKKISDG